MPLFSCSRTRASGRFAGTTASVSSFEPLSTTTRSCPATESRHCSSHGSALYVTTTTDTSGGSIGHRRPPEHVLPEHDRDSWQREQDRHHEEQEAAGERVVVVDAQLAEEADEERLAHTDAVDGERHEHHEEQQRAEHDVRKDRQVDTD